METGNDTESQRASGYVHPVATFFHFFWKIASLIIYFFGNWISHESFTFVGCVLMLAFDFWTVKNVTGRLLVGMRWWNKIKNGKSEWIYESLENDRAINPKEKWLFWSGLLAFPIIWVFLGIFSLFSPKWLLVALVALGFSSANIVGYVQCIKDTRWRLRGMNRTFNFDILRSDRVRQIFS